jgi:BirA family biotin operon repressor/biotin-[acetyl-CoA-carboxylase] ligase
LHADDLLSRLGETLVVGRDIRVFQETTSTNDAVERLARDGVKEGVVVFAESQTKGRGRLGRHWLSPPGQGLWCSVLLRPRFQPQEATRLTVAAATAVARALESQTGLSLAVKWPNDILVGGRKLAGILTELSAELDRVKFVVLGLGVDVNLSQSDFPPELRGVATSLRNELGRPCDRAELAVAVLRELDADYARVCRGEFDAVAVEWEARCATLGREVVIAVGDRQVRGRAESLDADGALLLRTQHGHLERIISGDVTLAREAPDEARASRQRGAHLRSAGTASAGGQHQHQAAPASEGAPSKEVPTQSLPH